MCGNLEGISEVPTTNYIHIVGINKWRVKKFKYERCDLTGKITHELTGVSLISQMKRQVQQIQQI
jgi:hypothetical protein